MEAHDVDVWSNDTSNAPFHNGAPIQFKKGTELSEEIHEVETSLNPANWEYLRYVLIPFHILYISFV
jgi:hypothetical protein